jgi:peroxin-16
MEGSSKWLTRYQQFLLKNSSQISSIESSLRSLSFILPGRFKDVEVASESLYSVLQILGLYHDSIIAKATKRLSAIDPSFRASCHNRYTEYQVQHNRLYRYVALAVQLTRYTEMLWEMVARKRGGERGRWMTVLSIESIKALLRLVLLFRTKRPLASPPIAEREVDPSNLEELDLEQPPSKDTWKMPRMGQGISTALPVGPPNIDAFLSEKVLTAEDVKSPVELLHKLESVRGTVAEVAYILRPLIYALLAYRYRGKPRNWTPWLAGVAIEYFSRRELANSYKENIAGGFRGLTKLEADELQKRGMALWWWSLRGAMYNNLTGPAIRRMLEKTAWIPGVGIFGSVLEDYLYLVDNYHFSCSSL